MSRSYCRSHAYSPSSALAASLNVPILNQLPIGEPCRSNRHSVSSSHIVSSRPRWANGIANFSASVIDFLNRPIGPVATNPLHMTTAQPLLIARSLRHHEPSLIATAMRMEVARSLVYLGLTHAQYLQICCALRHRQGPWPLRTSLLASNRSSGWKPPILSADHRR